MTVLGRWRDGDHAARFDRAMRLSLYTIVAAVPVTAALALADEPGRVPAMLLTAGQALVAGWLVHAALGAYLDDTATPVRRQLAAAVVATVAALVLSDLTLPHTVAGARIGPIGYVHLSVVTLLLVGVSLVVRPAEAVTAAVAGCLTVYVAGWLAGSQNAAHIASVQLYAGAALMLTFRSSAWMIKAVWQIERSRSVEAELAVAQERLRFARDLHDVVGRSLSAIALKAELAAQLSRRDSPEAITEMYEVRQVAEDSLAELRALVGGYRQTNLATELDGARSLLASAGITCRVIGDSAGLPVQTQTVLGWVIREGATNVLRHSDARTCTITLRDAADGAVSLQIDSDGAGDDAPPDEVRFGNGLLGLRERVTALGGTLQAEQRDGGGFRLGVVLPVSMPADVPAARGRSKKVTT